MAKFNLGTVFMTRGIVDSLDELGIENIKKIIARHSQGDWGELEEKDKEMNDMAVRTGEDRILSKYTINGESIYIITETDRSFTTIMFTHEY